MKIVKATKTFRQVTIICSLLMAIGSVLCLSIKPIHATNNCVTNIGAALVMVCIMWALTFFMLFLQAIHMVKCLKKYQTGLIAFYAYVVISVYVS